MIFDAQHLARGWLSVAVASSKDKDRPQLNRTVSIERFAHGVRLTSTDSYVLLRSWVPEVDYHLDPEPELDESPSTTAVAMDPYGRAKGFLAYVLGLATAEDLMEPIEVSLELGVIDADDGGFAGLEASYVVLDLPDEERLKLPTYEGAYPNWRKVVAGFEAVKTTTVALNPEIIGRLAKVGKINGDRALGWVFGGSDKIAQVEVIDSFPRVEGVVAPMRWDFEVDAPRVDDAETDEDES